ncbi:MAG: phosphatidate cytidylyltransferase [Rickettsiales bacterium]
MEHHNNEDTENNNYVETDPINDGTIIEESMPQEKQGGNKKWSGLSVRIVSGAVLASSTLIILWSGGFLFNLLIILAALQMLREWEKMTDKETSIWKLAGLFYISLPCASLLWLRGITTVENELTGFLLTLHILFIVWATDIGAYFSGKIIGGAKLAPSISPKKTWSGLGGGMAAAGVTSVVCFFFSPYTTSVIWVIITGFLISAISQIGDLFESWVKRRADIKDSSSLIPGHGGLLDRVDGLMFTIPLFAIIVYLSNA